MTNIKQIVQQFVQSNGTLNRIVTNIIGKRVAKMQLKNNVDLIKKLSQYKDIHKGQRCFIIGTGPSLLVDDIEKLKGEICFGSNRIFEIYPQTSWRPTYYMNQDLQLIQKYVPEIKALKANAKFLPIEALNMFDETDDIDYFILRYKEYFPHDAEFSKKLDHYLGQGFTVTYGAIQMAFWMGFSKVYLLGIDHNYSISLDENGKPVFNKNTKDYFAGSKASNVGLNLPRVAESTLAYYTAQKIAESSKDFTIYNATRGGKLEAFPRVDLDMVLKEQ